jgi:hypothetical protein
MCFCTIKMKLEIPVGLRKTMNNVENEKWKREEIEERLLREGKEFLFNDFMKQLHIVSYLYNSHSASYFKLNHNRNLNLSNLT